MAGSNSRRRRRTAYFGGPDERPRALVFVHSAADAVTRLRHTHAHTSRFGCAQFRLCEASGGGGVGGGGGGDGGGCAGDGGGGYDQDDDQIACVRPYNK